MADFNTLMNDYKSFQNDLKENSMEGVIESNLIRSGIRVINTPILQAPSLLNTANGKTQAGLGEIYTTDYTTSVLYLLEKTYKDNNWVSLVCNVIAAVSINCEPNFLLKSGYETRLNSFVKELEDILKFPNLNETWYLMLFKTYIALVLFGNAYWQVIKTMDGKIHGIYSIPAQTMRVVPYIDKNIGQLRFYYLQVNSQDGIHFATERVFDDTEVIHFKRPNPFSETYGMSAFAPLFANLKFDVQVKTWLNSYLENAYSGGMIFEMKESHKDIVERNRQELREMLSGAKNAGKNMILEGEIKLVNDGNKAKDFPIETLSHFNTDQILACAGTPLSQVGLRTERGRINSALIEAEEQAFLKNTIEPYQTIVFDTLNLKLLRHILGRRNVTISAGVNKRFSFSRAETLTETAMKVGATVNELRRIIGLPAIDDERGEKFVIGTNNGIVDAETYFELINVKLEKEKVDLENVKNGNVETKSTPKVEDIEDANKQPSLKVSPEKAEISLDT